MRAANAGLKHIQSHFLIRCGNYDFPRGQERLADNKSDGSMSRLFNPITQEEYERSLKVLNCEQRMRGYLVLKKKST